MNKLLKRWTPAELALLASHYDTHTAEQLGQLLGRSAKCVGTKLCRLGRSKDVNPGGFKPGHGGHRKHYGPLQPVGRQLLYFAPGARPDRQAPEGSTRLTKDRGITPIWMVRVGGQWVRLHRLRWEAQHGPLLAGQVLRCLSADTRNTEPTNWEAISRSQLAMRNNGYVDLSDQYVARMLTAKGGKGGIGCINWPLQHLVLQVPALLEVKRNQLRLNRAIKALTL